MAQYKKTTIRHALGSISLQQASEMTEENWKEHDTYVEKLKAEGRLGEIVETNFNFKPMSEFDTKSGKMDSGFLIPRGIRRDL